MLLAAWTLWRREIVRFYRQPSRIVGALGSPLLFLEHSEYTGLGYEETLNLQRAARPNSAQLRLYRLR